MCLFQINNTSAEGLSLKEAKKLMDKNKEKLQLVIRREHHNNSDIGHRNHTNANNYSNNCNNLYKNGVVQSAKGMDNNNINMDRELGMGMGNNNQSRANWSNQNVYVQPPTRDTNVTHTSSAARLNRSRNPLSDISLTQLDQPATPLQTGRDGQPISEDAPPRPPPPRPSAYGSPAAADEQQPEPPPTSSRRSKGAHRQVSSLPSFFRSNRN